MRLRGHQKDVEDGVRRGMWSRSIFSIAVVVHDINEETSHELRMRMVQQYPQ